MAAPTLDVPLTEDAHGTWRVAGTRVNLDTLLAAFESGATPEDIVQDFPVLRLADVYAVLAYSLREPEQTAAYRARRREEAGALRAKIGYDVDAQELRTRLRMRSPRTRGA